MKSEHRGGLTSVTAALAVSMHALVAALSAVVLIDAVGDDAEFGLAVVALVIGFVITYAIGFWPAGVVPEPGRRGWWWAAVLSVEWLALLWLSVDATYLVFALFFIYLRVLGARWGTAAVMLSTVVAIVAFGLHRGFDLAVVIGPVLGAAVAITIALGYEALTREVGQRQGLIDDLTRTRSQLAIAERAAGVAEERERLAREIHDTLSQSLSSIIMLLHAAQRAEPGQVNAHQRIEQAREAAEEALAETRQFIHALVPPALRTGGIGEALNRLAQQTQDATGLRVEVTLPDDTGDVPTPIQAALLRIAQSALANVSQHARANRVDLTLTRLDNEIILDVVDDGQGFDIDRLTPNHDRPRFGLVAMEERVSTLGGVLVVESSAGHGTSVVASFRVSS